jgi:SAM-dependent methyltransferase
MDGMTDGYVMGRTSAEAQRLQLQGSVLAPHSAQLFRLAGITGGMRVLDVGCGAGDVSMLLADLVGPTGSVIGVDMNPAILELARSRVAEAGLTNVYFVESDLADLTLDEYVDALAGRLILMHLGEPAATVRALSGLVRPGGVVTFQDYNITRSRAVPPIPLGTSSVEWISGAMRAIGLNPDTGDQIGSILRDAGLTVTGAATAGPAGTADSVMPGYVADTMRSFLPVILGQGLATEAEVDIDTFADRFTAELEQAGAMFWSPEMAAAWARVP